MFPYERSLSSVHVRQGFVKKFACVYMGQLSNKLFEGALLVHLRLRRVCNYVI